MAIVDFVVYLTIRSYLTFTVGIYIYVYIYFSALMLSKPVNLYKKAAGDVRNVARCTAMYCY